MGILTTVRVVANEVVAPGHRRLVLSAPEVANLSQPGEFIAVRCGRGTAPLLRRPFSISDVEEGDGLVQLLFRVVGEGTSRLGELREGEPLEVMGPLGRGFAMPKAERQVEALLVGGGIGVAPLIFLARRLRRLGVPLRAYLGARTGGELLGLPDLAGLGVAIETATEDGSHGHAGLVTEIVRRGLASVEGKGTRESRQRVVIYACGPFGMLRSLGMLAAENGAECQVAMEERMACGVGACQGCACARGLGDGLILQPLDDFATSHAGYLRVCRDGPVFRVTPGREDRG